MSKFFVEIEIVYSCLLTTKYIKDKCFRLLVKQNYMKRAYLANLESQYEMDYIMYLMMTSKIKGIYIGANNIIKRSKYILVRKNLIFVCLL